MWTKWLNNWRAVKRQGRTVTMPSLHVPILRRPFLVEDMEMIVATCRPASFVSLAHGDEDLRKCIDGLFGW